MSRVEGALSGTGAEQTVKVDGQRVQKPTAPRLPGNTANTGDLPAPEKSGPGKVVLDIGSGKGPQGTVNLDLNINVKPDIKGSSKALPVKTNRVDEGIIKAPHNDMVGTVDSLSKTAMETSRVVKPGGIIRLQRIGHTGKSNVKKIVKAFVRSSNGKIVKKVYGPGPKGSSYEEIVIVVGE